MNQEIVKEMRGWLSDRFGHDCFLDDGLLDDSEVVKGIEKYYENGLQGFLKAVGFTTKVDEDEGETPIGLPFWLPNRDKWVITKLKLNFMGWHKDFFDGSLEELREANEAVKNESWLILPEYDWGDYACMTVGSYLFFEDLFFSSVLPPEEVIGIIAKAYAAYEIERILPHEQLTLSLIY